MKFLLTILFAASTAIASAKPATGNGTSCSTGNDNLQSIDDGSSQTAAMYQSAPLGQLFSLYLDIKDALINGDSKAASAKAGELLKAINGIDMNALPEPDHKAFMPLQEKLAFDVRHISESKEIEHQRGHFVSLSQNFYTLAKGAKLSAQPVYEQYCPMKKAYWLSNEATIKNPYYGKAMLTCGKVADTIK